MYDDRKWVIVNVSDITDEMTASAIQTSVSTLRKSLDGTKAILKWEGDTPSCFDSMATYSHSEIKTELAKDTWTSDEG